MKSLLMHVHMDSGFETRLQTALDLVRASGGHLTCVYASPVSSYIGSGVFGVAAAEATAAMQIMQVLEDEEKTARAAIERRLANEDIQWDYVSATNDISSALVKYGSLADLVVLSHPARGKDQSIVSGIVSDVVMAAHTPVLLVPEGRAGLDVAGNASIAWNGSVESANALRAAMPLLKQAKSVSIIAIDELADSDLSSLDASRYLSRHGIHAEIVSQARGKMTVEDALVAAVRAREAEYLVMGAFGHSRMREYWFGGVTRGMIENPPLPILFAR